MTATPAARAISAECRAVWFRRLSQMDARNPPAEIDASTTASMMLNVNVVVSTYIERNRNQITSSARERRPQRNAAIRSERTSAENGETRRCLGRGPLSRRRRERSLRRATDSGNRCRDHVQRRRGPGAPHNPDSGDDDGFSTDYTDHGTERVPSIQPTERVSEGRDRPGAGRPRARAALHPWPSRALQERQTRTRIEADEPPMAPLPPSA